MLCAVAAGKAVYSEWPLGVDGAQTTELADAAAGVHSAIGLQAAAAPAVVAAAGLIADGRIGRVLDVSVLSTTAGFGPVVPEGAVALEDPATGMHLLTIQAAHTFDVVQRVAGDLASLSATLTTRFPRPTVDGTDRGLDRTLPDHVLVQGRTGDGVPVDVEVIGGRPADATPFALRVTGTGGTLELTGGAPSGFQAGRLAIALDGAPQAIPDAEVAALPDSVANVASVYARLRDDVLAGTHATPSFGDAVRLAALPDRVRESDARGARVDA